MPSSEHNQPSPRPTIVAVAVLYRRSILDSESVSSLFRILADHPEWRPFISLVLYDNSPEPQNLPENLPLTPAYVHNAANGGLAPAYNYALAQALGRGAPWLMLLDQDTTLTAAYLEETFSRIQELQHESTIAAIVPRLVAKGNVYSPESDFLYRMRMQFRSVEHPVRADDLGVQGRPMTAYNSGAVLRVTALEAIGGFSAEFWLDYLDHATFQELHRKGFRLFVMRSALEQQLSHYDVDDVPHWRHRNVLTAQTRFITRYGGWRERFFFRIHLLRTCLFLFVKCSNRSVWKEMLLQAFTLRIPSVRLGE